MALDSLQRRQYPQLGTVADFERWLDPQVAQRQVMEATSRTTQDVLTIPVVIHVIHSGQALGSNPNISNAQILSQMRVLNDAFRRKPGTSGYSSDGRAADTRIEFVLAKRTPTGQATTGIVRYNASTFGITLPATQSTMDNSVKPATIWNPNEYFNIWVTDLGSNLLGYAQFPTQSGMLGFTCQGYSGAQGLPSTDGLVMNANSFGSNEYGNFPGLLAGYTAGKVVCHEIGHWLGLRHIWGDATCGSDYVEDTPIHDSPSYGSCGTHPVSNSCGTADEMFENHMDYGSDLCKNIFTYGQGLRMRTILTTSERRRQLLNSPAANAPTPNDVTLQAILVPGDTCSGNLAPRVRIWNTGTSPLTSVRLGYRIDNGSWLTLSPSLNLASRDSILLALPTSTLTAGSHILTAYAAQPNGQSQADKLDTLAVPVRYGSTAPTTTQAFELEQFPPLYWKTVAGYNQCYKWTTGATPMGSIQGSSQAASFRSDNDVSGSSTGDLITELFALPAQACSLSINYAFGASSTLTNQLLVEISTDCGATWQPTPLISLNGSGFATTTNFTGAFWAPTLSSEWVQRGADLSSFAGQTIRLRFRATLSGAAALYLDNVMIRQVADPAPAITSFVPASGVSGSVVRIKGISLGSSVGVTFAGRVGTITSASDTVVTARIPYGAATGRIALRTVTATATSTTDLRILNPPLFTSFSPAGGPVGTTVTLRGRYLTGLQSVSFNGMAATSFALVSDTVATAVVPSGATSGTLSLATNIGNATAPGSFLVGSFTFEIMRAGSFSTCSTILLDPGGTGNYDNNLNVTMTLRPATPGSIISFQLLELGTESCCDFLRIYNGPNTSGTLLRSLSGTLSTPITLESSAPGGELTIRFVTDVSSVGTGFRAMVNCFRPQVPVITSFNPWIGNQGTTVTILGRSFRGVQQVTFGSVPARSFTVVDSGTLVAQAPTGVVTAPIRVSNVGGADTSAEVFQVLDLAFPCIPAAGSCSSNTISRIQLNTLHSSSTCGPTNYSAFHPVDSLTTRIVGGTAPVIAITSPGASYFAVWIDYDRDGYFTASNEQVQTLSPTVAGETARLTLSIPSGYTAGYMVMRVVSSASPISPSCFVPSQGEVEDYYVIYTPTLAPIITSFSPNLGPIGTLVTIRGFNFTGIQSILFGGGVSATYTQISDTLLQATVPAGAITGPINITNPQGTGSSTSNYYVGDLIVMGTGTRTVCSGVYTDPGGVQNYPDNSTVIQTLQPATPGKSVRISFGSFVTESRSDSLTIYDGPSTLFPILGSYSGSRVPFSLVSSHSSGTLTLRFSSSTTTNYPGWIAELACVDPPRYEVTSLYPSITNFNGTSFYMTGPLLRRTQTVLLKGVSTNFTYYAASQQLYTYVSNLSQPARLQLISSDQDSIWSPTLFHIPIRYCTVDILSNPSVASLAITEVSAPGTLFRVRSGSGHGGYPASQFPPLSDSTRMSIPRGLATRFTVKTSVSAFVSIAIDVNKDGLISSDEVYPLGTGASLSHTGSITIPNTTPIGSTLMRVMTGTSSYPTATDFCRFRGEYEDYWITVVPGDSQYVVGFSPRRGSAGTVVTLFGKGFTRATGILFNGSPATTFTVLTDTTIEAKAPNGVTSGPIQVVLPTRRLVSVDSFRVVSPGYISVLIVHATTSAQATALKTELLRFPEINNVDMFDARAIAPSLSTIMRYSVILNFSDYTFYDGLTLGNNLSTALEQGVPVVQGMFAVAGSPADNPAGRWGYYELIPFGDYIIGSTDTMGARLIPGHPILAGVTSFSGGAGSARPTTTEVSANTLRIANWSAGQPLVVARESNAFVARRVDLGFYPIPKTATSSGYDTTTQGSLLIKNALVWATGHSPTRGITTFSPDTARIGQVVTVHGRFAGIQSLKLGSQPLNYTLVDSSTLRFLIPTSATSDFLVADGIGWTSTSVLRLLILGAPSFTSTPVRRGYVGTPYRYTPTATDAVNSYVSITKRVGPSWLRFNGELSQGVTVSTFAGSGSFGSTDGPKRTASVGRAMNVDKLPNGQYVFADWSFSRIRAVTPTDSIITLAGSTRGYLDGPALQARFNRPTDMAVDEASNIYVADADNNCIRKITPGGIVSTLAGSTTAGDVDGSGALARFSSPTRIFYKEGYLYVSGEGNYKIKRVSVVDGTTRTLVGRGSSGSQDGPVSVATIGMVGDVFVNDDGTLYWADYTSSKIRSLAGGIVSTVAGGGAPGADGSFATAGFYGCLGMCSDLNGNLYVLDYDISRIRYMNFRTRTVSTLAGTTAGLANGPALQAQFRNPIGACLDGNTLFIADSENSLLRTLTLTSSDGNDLRGIPRAPGTYPVTLAATTRYGVAEQNFDIVVTACTQAAPSVTGDTACGTSPVTLLASGGSTFRWYDTDSSIVPLATGNTYSPQPGQRVYLASVGDSCESQRVSIQPLQVNLVANFRQVLGRLSYSHTGGAQLPTRFQWYYNGSPLPGATDSVFFASSSGNYALEIGFGACIDLSASQGVAVVGIKPKEGRSLTLLPNPARSQTTVQLEGHWPATTRAQLLDIVGKSILQIDLTRGGNMLDLSQLPAGRYVLRLATGEAYPLMVE